MGNNNNQQNTNNPFGQLVDAVTNNNNQQNTNNPWRQILDNTAVRIGPGGIKVEVNQDSACPPLLGDPAPPGCDETFADDGDIPCLDDTDCPDPGTCESASGLCNLYVPPDDTACQPPAPPGCDDEWETFYRQNAEFFRQESDGDPPLPPPDCPEPVSCEAVGHTITFTSPISAQYTLRSSCRYCSQTTCPPSRPCERGGYCNRPRCNSRGRCWCRGGLVPRLPGWK